MNKDTVKALKASIVKWQQITAGRGNDAGSKNCALCHLFFSKDGCEGCPVSESTGLGICLGSPYVSWCCHHMAAHTECDPAAPYKCMPGCKRCKELAKTELKFLKGLLPKKGK